MADIRAPGIIPLSEGVHEPAHPPEWVVSRPTAGTGWELPAQLRRHLRPLTKSSNPQTTGLRKGGHNMAQYQTRES